MSKNITNKAIRPRRPDRPAPGFEVAPDEPDYLVSTVDKEKYSKLEGVIVIRRAMFSTYRRAGGNKTSFYTATYEAVVNLEEWDTGNKSCCPRCGSTQAIHTKGSNGSNASFRRLECTVCQNELYHDFVV